MTSQMDHTWSSDTIAPTFPGPAPQILPTGEPRTGSSPPTESAEPKLWQVPLVKEGAQQLPPPGSGGLKQSPCPRVSKHQLPWGTRPAHLAAPVRLPAHCAGPARRRSRSSAARAVGARARCLQAVAGCRFRLLFPTLRDHKLGVTLARRAHPAVGVCERQRCRREEGSSGFNAGWRPLEFLWRLESSAAVVRRRSLGFDLSGMVRPDPALDQKVPCVASLFGQGL